MRSIWGVVIARIVPEGPRDNRWVHLIVPFASPLSDAGRAALAQLKTPQLDAWLARSQEAHRDDGDEWALAPPHERAFARAIGWTDAPAPWAARQALADGVEVGDRPWGLLTPVHWRVGSDAVHLTDPRALMLDEATSRTLLDAVRPLFESEGFTLAWGAPLRWYASHPMLANLPTASLERVIGRNVDRWLPAQREARLVRRLQNEVQMLLHTHPINDAREAAGLPAVNSFWLSGCGAARVEATHDALLDERLVAPALAEDWPAWADAWSELDASLPTRAPTRLTLCGERSALTLTPRAPSMLQRLARPFQSTRAARDTLATL
jgi:hypothetical protein